MAETTNISWSDKTWSPWYGCTQVSMGPQGACVGCYARFLSETRQGRVVFGGPGRGEGTRDAKAENGWKEPLTWERAVANPMSTHYRGRNLAPVGQTAPCLVFPSMCDPFDNHPAVTDLRRRFFDLIRATPHLTWLLLTKRPGNIVKLFRAATDMDQQHDPLSEYWPRNAAIGCTIVTQEEANRDIPHLLAAKAALNPAFAFVSMEPLLGPVDLRRIHLSKHTWFDALTGFGGASADFEAWEDVQDSIKNMPDLPPRQPPLDWVITGGETDQGQHKARPSHPDWFRSLRDQCATGGVAYHHKQNGEWMLGAGRIGSDLHYFDDGAVVTKAGKKAAGRLLDGVTHDARPEPRT